jgi:hypothetical protein
MEARFAKAIFARSNQLLSRFGLLGCRNEPGCHVALSKQWKRQSQSIENKLVKRDIAIAKFAICEIRNDRFREGELHASLSPSGSESSRTKNQDRPGR